MTRLAASLRPLDHSRATRLQLAWIDGDRYAFDVVLQELMDDPVGVPGLLFALVEFTTALGEQVAPDYADQLRAKLLHQDDDTPGGLPEG